MGITNAQSGTRIDEIADGIYRISTPVPPTAIPGGFTFNQFLVLDDEPLLFHTGPRRMFPLTREAMATVMPPSKLRSRTDGTAGSCSRPRPARCSAAICSRRGATLSP